MARPSLVIRREGQPRKLNFCESWQPFFHESFYSKQWEVNAPFLTLQQSTVHSDGRRENKHLVLNQRDVLPIISCQYLNSDYGGDKYKVQFHPDHHILIKPDVSFQDQISAFFFFGLLYIKVADHALPGTE